MAGGDGYDCTFVDCLPTDLQSACPICLHVLREPYLVGCCGYRFCRACIEPIQKKRVHRCPLCNEGFSSLPDKQLERILNYKLVYCAHRGEGCEWEGKLVELDSHLTPDDPSGKTGCPYEKTNCSYCEELFYRGIIEDHKQVCPLKPVVCTFCEKHKATPYKLRSQHYGECPMYPVPCPNGCAAKPFRKNIAKHVDDSCPLTIVECTLKVFGCDVKLARKDMPQHEDVKEHMLLAAVTIKGLQEENSRLKEKVESQESELKSIRTVKPKKAKKAKAAGKVSTPKVTKPISSTTTPAKCLHVANLPNGTTEQNLKSLFGVFGSVSNITMNGSISARIEYSLESSVKAALRGSTTKGIKLKSTRLSVNPSS